MFSILSRPKVFALATLVLDAFAVYLGWAAAYALRFSSPIATRFAHFPEAFQTWETYQLPLTLSLPMWILILHHVAPPDDHRTSSSRFELFVEVAKALLLGCFATLAGSFLTRQYAFSRLVLVSAAGASALFVFLFRAVLQAAIKRVRRSARKHAVAIIGNGKVPALIENVLLHRPEVETFGFNYPITPAALRENLKSRNINEAIFSAHPYTMRQLSPLIDECHQAGVECKVVPDLLEMRRGELIHDKSLGIPLFHVRATSVDGVNFFVKRAFDLILTATALVLLSPVMILTAILIKLTSPGPVFYRQERMGHRCKVFLMWKFRTMEIGADRKIEDLLALNERGGPTFKLKNDPRITSVGRLLRRFSIDELPQLFNVLTGQMSLIGPRPQVLREAEVYDESARRRLSVLPGITGLWQIRGRANLSYEDMIALDLYYLENWSLALDLHILVQTLPAVLSGRGAY